MMIIIIIHLYYRNYLRQTRHLDGIEASVLSHKTLLDDNQAAYQDVMLNNKINSHDILSFAWQISKGMSYLTDIKVCIDYFYNNNNNTVYSFLN